MREVGQIKVKEAGWNEEEAMEIISEIQEEEMKWAKK